MVATGRGMFGRVNLFGDRAFLGKVTMGPEEDHYIPGVCNIGSSESALRSRIGWVGLGGTIVLGILLLAAGVSPVWRLLIVIPAFAMTLGFLEAYLHFCVNFGLRSVFNFQEAGKTPEQIWKNELRAQDRKRAFILIGASAAIALAVGVIFSLMPF